MTHPNDEHGKHLALKISHEHSGYIFVNDSMQSIKMIVKHSGGTGARALRMKKMSLRRHAQKPGERGYFGMILLPVSYLT